MDADASNFRKLFTGKDFLRAFAIHLALGLLFWCAGKMLFRPPEVVIPIDLTIVPPWAEQTDDPDPDPNPPPKPVEQPKPKPVVETPKDDPKVEALQQIKEKPKPLNLKEKAKLVKTPPKPPEKLDLRKNAKKVDAPPMKQTGKATAAEKPLSAAEIQKLLNMGYKYGSKNNLAANEAQLCVSLIGQAIQREWDKENFKWFEGLRPLEVMLSLGPGGRVRGFRILRGSGDANVDRTAERALKRLVAIPGLTADFLANYSEISVLMEPTQL